MLTVLDKRFVVVLSLALTLFKGVPCSAQQSSHLQRTLDASDIVVLASVEKSEQSSAGLYNWLDVKKVFKGTVNSPVRVLYITPGDRRIPSHFFEPRAGDEGVFFCNQENGELVFHDSTIPYVPAELSPYKTSDGLDAVVGAMLAYAEDNRQPEQARIRAFRALWGQDSPNIRDSLYRVARGSDQDLFFVCASQLMKLGDQRLLAPVVDIGLRPTSGRLDQRETLAASIRDAPFAPQSLPELKRLSKASDERFRIAAFSALSALAEYAGSAIFVDGLSDTSKDVRYFCLKAIAVLANGTHEISLQEFSEDEATLTRKWLILLGHR